MRDRLKIGQIVYIHTKEKEDYDYIDNIVKFEVTKLDSGMVYLTSTKDSSITTSVSESKRTFVDCYGKWETLYLDKETFYKKANEYKEKMEYNNIYSKIQNKLKLLNYDEMKVIEKIFNL